MMKLYRNAIILVAVFGILIGAYVVLKDRVGGNDEGPGYNVPEVIRVLNLSTSDMAEITIENQGEKLVFVKNDREWDLIFPEGIKENKSALNSVAINASSIIAERIMEEEAADLAQYGLDRPSIVTVKLTDGTEKVVEIGNKTPTRYAYYVKEKGSSTVYTVDTYYIERILVSRDSIRDKTLFETDAGEMKTFIMSRRGELVFSAASKGQYDWEMLQPIKGNVNLSSLYPMMEAVIYSAVDEFIEDNPSDLAKYGLETPVYSFEFETAEGIHTLHMGAEKEKGSSIYAKLGEKDEVFTISLELYKFLDKPLKEIIEVFAYIVNINDVNGIIVEMDGYTVDCKLEIDPEDKDNDKFFVNGVDVSNLKDDKDKQYFRNYYMALIGVTLSDIDANANPQGTADITFTYSLNKDPGVMKVEFIERDEHTYYVVKNGEYSGIIVNKRKFNEEEGVRNMYTRMMEAMENMKN